MIFANNSIRFFFLFLVASTVIFSCAKDETSVETISETEAVEILESMVKNEVNTLTKNLDDLTKSFIESLDLATICNSPYSNTFSGEFNKEDIKGDYESAVAGEVVCGAFNMPQSITITALTTANYDGLKMSSNSESKLVGHVDGLELFSHTMTAQAQITADVTHHYKDTEDKIVQGTLSLDIESIEISKLPLDIADGGGTFTFSGNVSGKEFSFTGGIEFIGDSRAILTLNGKTFEFGWN